MRTSATLAAAALGAAAVLGAAGPAAADHKNNDDNAIVADNTYATSEVESEIEKSFNGIHFKMDQGDDNNLFHGED